MQVVPLDREDFHRALSLGLRDFEDAGQVAAALPADAHDLIMQNARDFRGAPMEVRSPPEAVAIVAADRGR